MKRKITFILLFVLFLSMVVIGATSKENIRQTTKIEGSSPFKGLMATGTADVTSYSMGTFYGILDSVAVGYSGTDADGFTVTVSCLPTNEANPAITFPTAIIKFTKLYTTSGTEYGMETTTLNGNVAVGAIFTGTVYITISDFEGTAWFVNLAGENTTGTNPSQGVFGGGRY